MVGWHHQLNRHEFEQAPGDGEGQESLECCSLWGCKESDTTEQQIYVCIYRYRYRYRYRYIDIDIDIDMYIYMYD